MKNTKNEYRQTIEGLVSFGEILNDLSTTEKQLTEGYLHLSRGYNMLIEDIEDKFDILETT